MRVDRDPGLAVGALGGQVDLVELPLPAERGAGRLQPPDRVLLVGEARAVPDLDQHPDAAGDHVACRRASTPGRRRRRPRRGRRIAAVSSERMLFVPSLKPMRLRGVAWARLVVDVRPNPSCDQRITTLPRPMRARLRTAWNATCGSSAQAWTHEVAAASARGRARRRAARGRARRAAGVARAQAEAVLAVGSNRPGPSPKVIGQPRRRQAERLAGVGGRRGADVVGRRPPARPALIRAAALVHARSRSRTSLARSIVQVEGGEVQPVLGRGGDPGLVRAVERDAWRRARSASPPSSSEREADRPRPRPSRRRRRAARAGSGRRPGHARYATMRAGTCESGSASASIAWLSLRVSALVRSV